VGLPLKTILLGTRKVEPDGRVRIFVGGGPTHSFQTQALEEAGVPIFSRSNEELAEGVSTSGFFDLQRFEDSGFNVEEAWRPREELAQRLAELEERDLLIRDGADIVTGLKEQFNLDYVDSGVLREGQTANHILPLIEVQPGKPLIDEDVMRRLFEERGLELRDGKIVNLPQVDEVGSQVRQARLQAEWDGFESPTDLTKKPKPKDYDDPVFINNPKDPRAGKSVNPLTGKTRTGFTAAQRRRTAIDELLERGVKDSSVATAMNLLNRRDALIASQQPGAAFEPQPPVERATEAAQDIATVTRNSPQTAAAMLAGLASSIFDIGNARTLGGPLSAFGKGFEAARGTELLGPGIEASQAASERSPLATLPAPDILDLFGGAGKLSKGLGVVGKVVK
jgi:hypothetical protein